MFLPEGRPQLGPRGTPNRMKPVPTIMSMGLPLTQRMVNALHTCPLPSLRDAGVVGVLLLYGGAKTRMLRVGLGGGLEWECGSSSMSR